MRVYNNYSELSIGYQVAKSYAKGDLKGWDAELAKEAFRLFGNTVSTFKISNQTRSYDGKKRMLFDITRKVLGKDTKNYPQEIGDPFERGTKVLMSDGTEKNVEDIKVGEKVINHKGEVANVTNVIAKPFTGRMVTIELRGWHRKLTATETHHGMKLPYHQYRFKYNGTERVKFGELNVGDYMLIPFGIQNQKEIILDLDKFLTSDYKDENFIYLKKEKINRFIRVDEKFARFVGLYLAEGGCTKSDNIVYFCFNSKEILYMEEIKAYLQDIFGITDCRKHKTGNKNCTRIVTNSKLLKDFFKKIIPGNLYRKNVPIFFYQANNSTKLALIRGWLDGDGYKDLKNNDVIGYTSSDRLGDDIARLSLSCGINIKSWTRFRKKRARVQNTEIGFYGTETYKVYNDVVPIRTSKTISCNNTPYGFARPIKSIRYKYVENETVYCITTENEYTAIFNGIAQYQCVSFGAKNATEYVSCTQILMGKREKFRPIFPPYYYGTGRVFIGGQRSREDGSTGLWQVKAANEFGALFSDADEVPPYSGKIAKDWGYSGPPDKFVPLGKQHITRSTALIKSFNDLVAAIVNGYPCTTASNVGYNMEPSSDGFHRKAGNWAHQMCFIGVGFEPEPYALILNNWGDVHGHLKDFDDSAVEIPVGVLRVRQKDAEAHIRAGETFAWSQYDGFPEQDIDEALFKVIGN